MKKLVNLNNSTSIPLLLVGDTYKNWRNDRTLRLGAGIAYYGVFTIIPIFTLMFGVAAYFYSKEDVKSFISDVLVRILGYEQLASINQIVERVFSYDVQSIFTSASLIGVITLLITSSIIFVAFQDALDVIWKNNLRLGLKAWIKKYIWAYLIVLLASSLLFLVFLANSIGSIFVSVLPGQLSFVEFLGNILVKIATWIVGVLVMSVIYRILIYKNLPWKIVIFGSAVTSVLIIIGTWLLGIYIQKYGGTSISGALGGVLLLLLWVYYQSQIALIGAQFIKALYENRKKLPKYLQL